MHVFYIGAVYLHILAAVLWVGGMLFFTVVLVPLLRQPDNVTDATELVHLVGLRFRTVGWSCIAVLLATGTIMLAMRAQGLTAVMAAAFWRTSFGGVLAIKLAIVAVIVFLSAVHDFAVGPRATEMLRTDRTAPAAQAMRRWASWLGRTNLILALAVLAMAVFLVRGSPL